MRGPTDRIIKTDSNLEMDWKTFAREYDEDYLALVESIAMMKDWIRVTMKS